MRPSFVLAVVMVSLLAAVRQATAEPLADEDLLSSCKAQCAGVRPDQRLACIGQKCRSMYRMRVSRFNKRLDDASAMTLGKRFSMDPSMSYEDILSACSAFCQAGHPDAVHSCMETNCRDMYRDRVSRFGKRQFNAPEGMDPSSWDVSVCQAYCKSQHPEQAEVCVEMHCRSMYRERVGRFGKRQASTGFIRGLISYLQNSKVTGAHGESSSLIDCKSGINCAEIPSVWSQDSEM